MTNQTPGPTKPTEQRAKCARPTCGRNIKRGHSYRCCSATCRDALELLEAVDHVTAAVGEDGLIADWRDAVNELQSVWTRVQALDWELFKLTREAGMPASAWNAMKKGKGIQPAH